jgi:phosphoribosylamine--glycine ligase
VDVESARRAAREFGTPVVIKASGLAAGKGVLVCDTMADAERAIDAMLRDDSFGPAGRELLVEEWMAGEEISLFAITDGKTVLPMLAAQDHKRLLDGDRGPNTGGMGAYAPVSLSSEALVEDAVERVFQPTLGALRAAGAPFSGLLYAGLMLTPQGAKVVEFNCRFGDPETEAILPLLESSLLEPMLAVAKGEGLSGKALKWSRECAVTTVVAADGYPDRVRKGDPIELPPREPNIHVFHSGTGIDADGNLIATGGRVFAVTAVASTLAEARRASVRVAESVRLEGKQLRTDIGWREQERSAGATGD